MGQKNENINKIKQKQSQAFLLEEFKECFSHMRHYDNLKLSLTKFAFSFYSAVATVSFVLERYFYYQLKIKEVDIFLSIILFLTFLIGLIIIVTLARYRKYFVLVARQVNSIRKYYLELESSEKIGFENLLYTETNQPVAFNIRSTYLFIIYMFSLVNSIAISFSGFFVLRYFNSSINYLILLTIPLFTLALLFESLYIRGELREKKNE